MDSKITLNIFEFSTYKAFLRSSLPPKGPRRGGRSRLAEFLRCKLGFVSQVLGGKADFSMEHGIVIADFLKLSDTEREYFLLLLQKDRAGSTQLRAFYEARIVAMRLEREQIKSRIKKGTDLTESQKNTYYGKWFYTAVHMCTLVPALRTPERMKHYLEIPRKDIQSALEHLEEFGVIQRSGNEFVSTQKRFHLAEKSNALRSHHTNWRIAAIRSLDSVQEPQLHYSSVMSISASAAAKIRDLLLKSIEECEPIIAGANDEEVYALAIDLFEVGSN